MKTKIDERICETCSESYNNNKKINNICNEICEMDNENWEPAPKRCVFCVHYPEDEPFHPRWNERDLSYKRCKEGHTLENRENQNIDWAQLCIDFKWKYPELMESKGEFKLSHDPTDMSKWDMNDDSHLYWAHEKDYKPDGIPEYKETGKVHICVECTKHKKEGCPFYKNHTKPKQIITCSAFDSTAKQDFIDSYNSIFTHFKKNEKNYLTILGTRKYNNDFYEEMINQKNKEGFIWDKKSNNKKIPKESNIESIKTMNGTIIPKFKDKYNKIELKGGVKDMEGLEEHKKEVEKIRKLINEIEEKRQKQFDKSCFKKAFKYKYYSKMYRTDEREWKIKKDFYRFLKDLPNVLENLPNKTIADLPISLKKLKKYKLTTSTLELLTKKEFSNEEWKEFENILYIIDKYYPKFELHQEQKKLCFLTDCYKKLATEKTCEECGSVNPKEAKFCNQCGYNLRGL